MKTKNIFIFTLFFLITFSVNAQAVSVGDKALPFTLTDLAGNEVSLKNFADKIVFLNFWATWCEPCKQELPLLSRFQGRNKEVIVIAINIDKKRASAKRFLKKYPLDLLVLSDPDGKVVKSYKPFGMPVSFIIDGRGVVKKIHLGFNKKKDPALWEKEIMELLKIK